MSNKQSGAPAFEPNYQRMFVSAVECLAIIDKALGISDATHIVGGAGPALSEIQKLKEQKQRVTAERDALQLRLNAADQRVDELERGHGQQVAYVLTRDGEVCYEADDGIVISNTPGDETDLYKWRPVYFGITGSPAEVAQKLIKQLTDEYSDPDTLLTVECIGDLITEYLTYPQ